VLPKELQDWAKSLIVQESYAAKTVAPPLDVIWTEDRPFVDPFPSAPHRVQENLPDRPGRPRSTQSLKDQGPVSRDQLEKPFNQAKLLHSFANHELLAIEVMALVLLRFPDAPMLFQKGLIQTMRDEQKHFMLYQERLRELGFDFGYFGLNEYLWNVCRSATSPLSFVTQMSLTFEQANLDYAVYFQKIFENLNEAKTAEILATVYRDETKHVHHGLVWFNQWRSNNKSDWEEYQEILEAPLSPARAKGLSFQADIRQKLGFSDEFVRQLSVYQQSKGRPADVWWFNPSGEAELQNGRPSFQPSETMQNLAADFSSLLMFLAKKDDVVIVTRKPSPEYLLFLCELGFMLPEFVNDPTQLLRRKLGTLIPWSVTARSDEMPKVWNLSLKKGDYNPEINRKIARKSWSKQISLDWCQQGSGEIPLGVVCQTIDEVGLQMGQLFNQFDCLVAKSDYSCSGRGRKKLSKGKILSDPESSWLKKQLSADGSLTLEPWVEKVADFSTQILVQDGKGVGKGGPSKIKVLGTTRFMTDHHGQYLGHYLGDQTVESPPGFWRWYHEHSYSERLKKAALFVGEKLFKLGYRGPAGIDALVYRAHGIYQLYPIVEVNTRWTMGSLALVFNRKIPRTVPAKWLHLSLKSIRHLGFSSFSQFASDLNQRYPLQADSMMIVSGVVPTTDPALAQHSLSLIVVGNALECFQRLFKGSFNDS
jgi:uncharacterized ferritin-like protein (DUF455 family)